MLEADITQEAKYPGDAIRLRLLIKGDELGDVRIQDYGSASKQRYKVGTFLPGVTECTPGDTPKTWPEKDFWTNDGDEAIRVFTLYVMESMKDGWKLFNKETGRAAED
jgi:hypothetical protein